MQHMNFIPREVDYFTLHLEPALRRLKLHVLQSLS